MQSENIVEGGMDWVYTFFRLDSGAVFALPLVGCNRFLFETPRPECREQNCLDLQPILGRTIENVLQDGPDSENGHDSPYLLMDNGYLVTDVMGYPSGCGYAGLHIYAPGEIDTKAMIEFFQME